MELPSRGLQAFNSDPVAATHDLLLAVAVDEVVDVLDRLHLRVVRLVMRVKVAEARQLCPAHRRVAEQLTRGETLHRAPQPAGLHRIPDVHVVCGKSRGALSGGSGRRDDILDRPLRIVMLPVGLGFLRLAILAGEVERMPYVRLI